MPTIPRVQPPLSKVPMKDLRPFYDLITKILAQENSIKLQLKQSELLLLTATFQFKENPKLFITKKSDLNPEAVTELLSRAANRQNVNETWHYLSGELSEHEINGDITTELTTAIHHLLGRTPGHHYLLPTHLVEINFPDPDQYLQKTVTLHRHEKLALTALVRQLINSGYVRANASSVEPGTLRLRGEQLDIKHPIHNGLFVITFYGPHIEKIEYQTDSRKAIVPSVTLPPVSFSSLRPNIASLTKNFIVLQPAHVNLPAKNSIIYDSLHPDYEFPRVNIPTFIDPKQNQPKKSASSSLVVELQENKPAVHSDHGIGIFEGIKKRRINDKVKDYLILRYADGDTLSVPVEYAHKVSAYIGDSAPVIHRLGSPLWQKTRRAAEHNAILFAQDLIKVAAARHEKSRPGYVIDSSLEDQLEKTFPYQLTPDQITVWEDIKKDLVNSLPMDRLVVGDVGFGKTELAIRAARHTINNGIQVAILAPTTLLVQQHYDTLLNRLPEMKNQVGFLSRFSTNQDKKEIYRLIHSGQMKILVGTHAILNKNIGWKNLGLLIIDEEQRFGVKHKEHFKALRSNLDILSLSATPIPRTLYMSLSGLKQLSVINTAPLGRKSVITKIAQNNPKIFQKAITRELERGGQVYIVAPHIRKLGEIATNVQQQFPQSKIGILHSRLPGQRIAEIMRQFDQQEINILVSSTIIANGLDLPNANTLIVTSATHLGLADLYQLRGRIGRRDRQGYAYFLISQFRVTDVQRQRLAALIEASRLNSGWKLAQRDLEIRGAGNILGASQSGTVNAVGIQLYLDMIKDAVDKQTSHAVKRHDVNIRLPISAYIPTSYIPHLSDRTNCYQKLSRSQTLDQLDNVLNLITAAYGPAPDELVNLLLLLRLQHLASAAGITSIDSQLITPPGQPAYYKIIFTVLNPNHQPVIELPGWRWQDDNLIYQTRNLSTNTIKKIAHVLSTFHN